jgi:predicted small lipoprotein YifL
MLRFIRILVTPFVLGVSTVGLLGCGQPGALYLPTEPSAAKRATLPEALLQTLSINPAQPASSAGPASTDRPVSSPLKP